jgi:hypothetical protein
MRGRRRKLDASANWREKGIGLGGRSGQEWAMWE